MAEEMVGVQRVHSVSVLQVLLMFVFGVVFGEERLENMAFVMEQ